MVMKVGLLSFQIILSWLFAFILQVTKEVCKLLGKKNSVDLSGGDSNIKMKKKKEKDVGDPVSSLDNMFSRFRKLSYYDQHVVTQTGCKSLVEAISNFASAGVGYLPQIDNVSFLFDLMEYCLNISRLLELSIQVCKNSRVFMSNEPTGFRLFFM